LEKDMKAFHSALAALVIAGVVGVGACRNDGLDPTTAGSKSPEAAISGLRISAPWRLRSGFVVSTGTVVRRSQ
jgi:hypothetical protein